MTPCNSCVNRKQSYGVKAILKRIVYFSVAADGFDDSSLEAIVDQSNTHNANANITGVLLFNGTSFLQVLEGPVRAVDELYSRITYDARHRNVMQLESTNIDERTFDGWGMRMKYVPLNGSSLRQYIAEGDNLVVDLPDQIPAHVQTLLNNFARIRG